METVNRPDRLHTISSDRGHWGDRGDYMETRLYATVEIHLNSHEARWRMNQLLNKIKNKTRNSILDHPVRDN